MSGNSNFRSGRRLDARQWELEKQVRRWELERRFLELTGYDSEDEDDQYAAAMLGPVEVQRRIAIIIGAAPADRERYARALGPYARQYEVERLLRTRRNATRYPKEVEQPLYTLRSNPVTLQRIKLAPDAFDDFGPVVRSPVEVFQLIQQTIGDDATEIVLALALDSRNRVLAIVQVGQGGVSESQVEIGSVLKTALLKNAAGMIIAHNHPSGDPEPSSTDVKLMGNIKELLALHGITLVDFVVVSFDRYVSARGRGLL